MWQPALARGSIREAFIWFLGFLRVLCASVVQKPFNNQAPFHFFFPIRVHPDMPCCINMHFRIYSVLASPTAVRPRGVILQIWNFLSGFRCLHLFRILNFEIYLKFVHCSSFVFWNFPALRLLPPQNIKFPPAFSFARRPWEDSSARD